MKNHHTKTSSGRKALAAIASLAAVFVLCLGAYRLIQPGGVSAADSIIMLDVNPSLSISVDEQEKVTAVEPLNDDAREVLGTMELENTSLEVAVNAIIGSMLQKGYLDDAQNSVLVSVEDADTGRSEQLQQKVSQAIVSAMEGSSVQAAVLSQNVDTGDEALAALAEQYSISLGKAALIQEVISQTTGLTFEDLAGMSITEIALIADSKQIESQTVVQSGSASDKAYIGSTEALRLACADAGVSAEELVRAEVEFDSEKGVMVYEVEFETASLKGEYDIDAVTGAVLKRETKTQSASGNDTGVGTDTIGADAAKQAALADAGVSESDTKYLKCYVEYRNGVADHYEVEFEAGSVEYEYQIDLYTGAVLDSEKESHNGQSSGGTSSGDAGTSTAAYIGEDAALAAALTHAGVSQSDITELKVELHDEDHVMVYEVEFRVGHTEYEYDVNAATGAILKAQQH